MVLIARPQALFGQISSTAPATPSADGVIEPSEKGTPAERLIAVGYVRATYTTDANFDANGFFSIALVGVLGATGACMCFSIFSLVRILTKHLIIRYLASRYRQKSSHLAFSHLFFFYVCHNRIIRVSPDRF